jgi:phosphopantothenoylcysteine decarboxylase/phosphopantothenate--cysteine ligase|tara:strand:- start:5567 stop:6763 length:1197 start_codon:yes stop_codon:yes gene_type:complete
VSSDLGVEVQGDSLGGRNVLLVVSGGIAAVESVKLSREIRRHGANLSIIMTKDANKVITPLALSWAAASPIITEWDSEMSQLSEFDGILVAPATRNTISKHIHGVMDSPAMMALSAARGNKTPLIFVPSMHTDLFDDPVTSDLINSLESEGSHIILDQPSEGKRKQPNHIQIVAELCNCINQSLPDRKNVAITLGANRAPIDSVRAIQNASSGATGWRIAEHLFRMGHEVVCIAGVTSSDPNFTLPHVIRDGTPTGMLNACLEVASVEPKPDAWIHAAAVLDYYTEPISGKKPSGQSNWNLQLTPGPKHIEELSHLAKDCVRIGFKLEVDVPVNVLLERATEQISRLGTDAVVANLKDEVHDPNTPRGRIVLSSGDVLEMRDDAELCRTIESLLHIRD